MKPINVSQLIIEVGRRCNRNCDHCLRGKQENKTICLESVYHLLSQLDNIGYITFTGGEPTLYGKEISAIVNFIIENKVPVNSFYVASNGEIYNEELMLALVRLYAHCQDYGDNEATAYDVSNDQFHKPKKDVLNKLRAFAFFQQRSEIKPEYIINEGNATENGIGHRNLNHMQNFEVSEDDYDVEIEMLYLNAEGYLLPVCDYSYETQRELSVYRTLAEVIECPYMAEKLTENDLDN